MAARLIGPAVSHGRILVLEGDLFDVGYIGAPVCVGDAACPLDDACGCLKTG